MTTPFAPCPKCNQAAAEKLTFTWWGGLLGPKILTHVKCTSCGYKYNGKTGKDNTTGIIIYSVIVGVFMLALVVVIFTAVAALIFTTR